MKQVLFILFVSIGAFVAGIGGALLTASMIVDEAWDRAYENRHLYEAVVESSYQEEFLLSWGINTVELLDNRDLDQLYQTNCLLLATQLRMVRPELIDDEKVKVRLLGKINNARQALDALESQGRCVLTD